MQVYLTKDGAPQGPFSVGQLRQYVETGHCQATDYACHDGTNWVTIADVPGIAKKAHRKSRSHVLDPPFPFVVTVYFTDLSG